MRTYNFRTYAVALFLLVFQVCLGQNKQESERFALEGKKWLASENFVQAANFYRQSVEADTSNMESNLLAAICLLNYSGAQALSYLHRLYQFDSTYRPDLHYLIGLSLQKGYRFKEALVHYKMYLKTLRSEQGDFRYPSNVETLTRIQECEVGIEMIHNPRPINILNLGRTINSEFADYGPVADKSESIVIFTSRRKENNLNPSMEKGYYFEDIYYSTRNGLSWQPALNVGLPINTIYHESVICLSAEGDKLYIYKDTGEGDVYVSTLDSNEWSDPHSLQIVNSPYSERSMTISNGGDTIIFSSNRPGGLGGFDLYRTTFDGKYWSRPQNLGPAINTEKDDDSPALNSKSDKLYFSSKGWKGMGGFDIYVTNFNNDEEPVNLGYPINTPEDDIYLIPTSSGESAYFASARSEGFGDLDIYVLHSLDGNLDPELKELKAEDKTSEENLELNLKTLFFEFAKTQLIPSSEETLKRNIELLQNKPSAKIRLIGHTDNIGNERENAILAMERAMKVAIRLKQNGISESRIQLEARGECCPIVPNEDSERIFKNRRVEFEIIVK